MDYCIREAIQSDVPFLWEMLFHAAHMHEDGATSADAAKGNETLAPYVADWGRPGDLGFMAYACSNGEPVGASWVRLMAPSARNYGYVDKHTPELAIAVLPK